MINKFINKIHCGDCLEVMKQLPDSSVDSVITSPPYWQLRDYEWDGQWGKEPTYQQYLEHLWSFMDETCRILKPTGTVWINLSDTYGTQGGQNMGKSYKNYAYSENVSNVELGTSLIKGDVPHKCLLLIPHRFAIGCIDKGWIMRNDIIWAKRNCMPESVTDRFSKKHEYIFFMTKQPNYYFDLSDIKDKTKTNDTSKRNRDITKLNNTPGRTKMGGLKTNNYHTKNPGTISDFWDIKVKPSSEAHHASYNFKIIEKPIVAGCPKGGIVLDPFSGTGTTLVRALQLGRQVIGIDGSEEYCRVARRNIAKELNQTKLFT